MTVRRIDVKRLLFAILVAAVWVQAAPPAMALGASSIEEFRCSLPRSVSGLRVDLSTNDQAYAVATPSGQTLLECHFDIPDGYWPDRTFRNEGFRCKTFKGTTYNSAALVTPGGKAHLKCQIKS
jgi:hypothetical protein